MTEVTEYTREICIPKNISPTGVRYAVFRDPEVDLYYAAAVLVDEEDHGIEKPDGRRAKPLDGMFTGNQRTQRALTKWLELQWDASDAQKIKNMKPAERAALNKATAEQVAA